MLLRENKEMSGLLKNKNLSFRLLDVKYGETTLYSYLKKQYSVKEKFKEEEAILDKLIEEAQEFRKSFQSEPRISLLIASMYLYRGSKTSAILYAQLITPDQFQLMLNSQHNKNEIDFLRLLIFFVLILLTSECFRKSDFKLGIIYAKLAISATPPEHNVLLCILELLGDQLGASSELISALKIYDQILSFLPHLSSEKNKSAQYRQINDSETNIINPMLSTVSSTSFLNKCLDVYWPDIFGLQGWIPEVLANTLKFTTNSFVHVIVKASSMCYQQDPSQLMNLMKYLRLGYSIDHNNPIILLKLADVGFLLKIEDLENYYVSALQFTLPRMSLLQNFDVSVDPLLMKQTDSDSKKSFLQETAVYFENDAKLLAECLLVVARNYLKHQKYSEAKPLLFGIEYLIGFESHLDHGYKYPNTAKLSSAFMHAFSRMMVKWAYASKTNEYIHKYGNYLLSSEGFNADVLTLLADISAEQGNLEEALLRYRQAFLQIRRKQSSTKTEHDMATTIQIHLAFQSYSPSKFTHIFSLTDMYQEPWLFLYDFVINFALSDAELEIFLAQKILNISKHPLINDLEAQREFLQVLCTHNPRSNEYRYQLACVFEKQNKLNESKILYIRVLNFDPRHVNASIRLALIYYNRKKYNEAFEVLSRVEKLDIQNVLYYELFARVCLDCSPIKIEQAVLFLKKAIKLEPFFIKAIYKLGLIYYSCLKELTLAKIFMKQVLDLSEKVVGYEDKLKVALGSNEFVMNNLIANKDLSSRDYRLEQLGVIRSHAAIILSEILLFEGRVDSCDTILTKVCDSSLKEKHRFIILSARIKYVMCQFKEALKLLKPTLDVFVENSDFLEFSTELSDVYNLAAQTCERLDLLKEAQYYVNKAIELNPQSASSLITRAWILIRCDFSKSDEAISLCIKAEKLDAESPLSHLFRGYFFLLRRQFKQAVFHLQIASDRLEYVWTYYVASRYNCPQSYIVLCKVYILLCWYVKIRKKYLSDDSPTEKSFFEALQFFFQPKHLKKFTEVLNEVDVFYRFFEHHKKSSSLFSAIFENFEKDVKEKLQQRFLLQETDWKYVKELCLAYGIWMTSRNNLSPTYVTIIEKSLKMQSFEKNHSLPSFPLKSKIDAVSLENSKIDAVSFENSKIDAISLENSKIDAVSLENSKIDAVSLENSKKTLQTKEPLINRKNIFQTQYSYEIVDSNKIKVMTENKCSNDSASILSLPSKLSSTTNSCQRAIAIEKKENLFSVNSNDKNCFTTETTEVSKSELTPNSSALFTNKLQKYNNSLIYIKETLKQTPALTSLPLLQASESNIDMNKMNQKTETACYACVPKAVNTNQGLTTEILSKPIYSSEKIPKTSSKVSLTNTYKKNPRITVPVKSLLCEKKLDGQNMTKTFGYQLTNERLHIKKAKESNIIKQNRSQTNNELRTKKQTRLIKNRSINTKASKNNDQEIYGSKSKQVFKRQASRITSPEKKIIINESKELIVAAKECAIRQKLVALGVPNNKIFAYRDIIVHKCLGRGGFGTVYSGIIKYTGQAIAIKHLQLKVSSDSLTQWYDALSEIQAIFYLQHPSLIEFVGLSLRKTNLYILTELCTQGSLYHQLHTNKRSLPPTWCIRHKIAMQLVSGLTFLHSLEPKVIHRDLKSLNVVLDEEWNAKICDFGLTTSMNIMKSHLSLIEGANGGSPRYMAPECYHTSGIITEKVDIWSLGCILIEIFGGPLPYHTCQRFEQIVQKLLVEKQIPEIHSSFPVQLQLILKGCLQFSPAARWDAKKVFQHLQVLPEFKIVQKLT